MTTATLRPRVSANTADNSKAAKQLLDHFRTVPSDRRVTVTLVTKYLSPTDTMGSRYKAIDQRTGQTATVAADYSLNSDENHCAACVKYLQSIAQGQQFELISYEDNKAGTGYTFVFEWL